MIVKILIDNISNAPTLTAEWGLSLYIEHQGRKYLLDAGASDAFAHNAEAMGVDLAQVDCAVLSHAHYDHADGMDAFFARNDHAPLYLRAKAAETCYGSDDEGVLKYIGIKKGLLTQYADRIRYAEGKAELAPGVYLLGHTTRDLYEQGQLHQMFLKIGDQYMYDDFRHEQSLIFDTDQGLVIFNSCCHGGADLIIQEAMQAFPGRKVHAIIGGFHLFDSTNSLVEYFAKKLGATGVEHIITGHCTGQTAFDILRKALGDRVQQMETGLTFTL